MIQAWLVRLELARDDDGELSDEGIRELTDELMKAHLQPVVTRGASGTILVQIGLDATNEMAARAAAESMLRDRALEVWTALELPPFTITFVDATREADNEEVRMLGWVGDIERTTLENTTFRTVVYTGDHVQLTVMRLLPGEDIGREAHADRDQFLRIESGTGRVEFGRSEGEVDETYDVQGDWAIVVPAGVWHNVVNTGDGELKLYSLYAPPEHPEGTIHRTKADAAQHE